MKLNQLRLPSVLSPRELIINGIIISNSAELLYISLSSLLFFFFFNENVLRTVFQVSDVKKISLSLARARRKKISRGGEESESAAGEMAIKRNRVVRLGQLVPINGRMI